MSSMKARRVGRIYQPSYRDQSGERRHVRVWWVRFGCRRTYGKAECSGLHQENSHSDDPRIAEKLLRKRLGEVDRGRLVTVDVERTMFEDLAQMIETDYVVNRRKSSERLNYSLVHLREAFGNSRALAITTDRIKEFIKQRQQAGAANGTIACELACLKRMFVLAHQAERIAHRPYIPSIQTAPPRSGFFEQPQLDAVLKHLPAALVPAIKFAAWTGWRKNEILKLTWANIDFVHGGVRLEPGTTKNSEGRTFPFLSPPRPGRADLRPARADWAVAEFVGGKQHDLFLDPETVKTRLHSFLSDQ